MLNTHFGACKEATKKTKGQNSFAKKVDSAIFWVNHHPVLSVSKTKFG